MFALERNMEMAAFSLIVVFLLPTSALSWLISVVSELLPL